MRKASVLLIGKCSKKARCAIPRSMAQVREGRIAMGPAKETVEPAHTMMSRNNPRAPAGISLVRWSHRGFRQTGVLDVNIDTGFVNNIRHDNFAPVVCDSGRYIAGKFRYITQGDLFYELGFRNNDGNLRVRGHLNGSPTTAWFDLNVPNQVSAALVALRNATGLHFRVQRTGAPSNTYNIWLKVMNCNGFCPTP